MKNRSHEPLMEEELDPKELEDITKNRAKARLKQEEDNLFYNYDDSSDDEETLDYEKEVEGEYFFQKLFLQDYIQSKKIKIKEMREYFEQKMRLGFLENELQSLKLQCLINSKIEHPDETTDKTTKDIIEFFDNKLQDISNAKKKLPKPFKGLNDEQLKSRIESLEEEEETLTKELQTLEDLKDKKLLYLMEIEGRKVIYSKEYRTEYKKRKYETLGKITLEVKDANFYNQVLVDLLLAQNIITEEQAIKWNKDQLSIAHLKSIVDDPLPFMQMQKLTDNKFFDEENKFRFLRKFLRQTNREAVDESLLSEISSFANALEATQMITNDILKSISKTFIDKAELSAKRPTLNRTRVNSDIESVSDFYAEEILRYRSLTRSSREIAGKDLEIVQTMVFDAQNDLASQKKQTIAQDKREDLSLTHYPHRGTTEEEVLNLGSYQDILSRLDLVKLDDRSKALIIREIFKNGVKKAFDAPSANGIKYSKLLPQEEKQLFIDLVELLFGTEGFRSPSAIVETNMMLDLIIEHPAEWSFAQAFTGKTLPNDLVNGGHLSYTMKAKPKSKATKKYEALEDNYAGGIACGRQLSQALDKSLPNQRLKKHKYGGPLDQDKEGFAEFIERKEAVADSWMAKCRPQNAVSFQDAIQKSREKWYSPSL